MNGQQLVVLFAILAASLYLGRNLWRAWVRFRNPSDSGCASGCGKCGYAGPDRQGEMSLPVKRPPDR